jgi:hypothetical protein
LHVQLRLVAEEVIAPAAQAIENPNRRDSVLLGVAAAALIAAERVAYGRAAQPEFTNGRYRFAGVR